MLSVVDLDVAVREIERRAVRWNAQGFEVGPVTWPGRRMALEPEDKA